MGALETVSRLPSSYIPHPSRRLRAAPVARFNEVPDCSALFREVIHSIAEDALRVLDDCVFPRKKGVHQHLLRQATSGNQYTIVTCRRIDLDVVRAEQPQCNRGAPIREPPLLAPGGRLLQCSPCRGKPRAGAIGKYLTEKCLWHSKGRRTDDVLHRGHSGIPANR